MQLNRVLVATAAIMLASPLVSATSPVDGRWTTLDDETGRAMSVVEVSTTNNVLTARVVETLNTPNATCSACSGSQRGKPIVGMRVLWDLKPTADGWGNGSGFKPSTGDSFKAKSVKLSADGKTLEVTGCKMSVLCRTAKWSRAG